MTRHEFAKGWMLLIAQPWGRRYEGDTEIAATQRELYFARFSKHSAGEWFDVCAKLAEKNEWPSIGTISNVLNSRIRTGHHPMPEEAWSIMAPVLRDEWVSIVCTDEMLEAFAVALPLSDNQIQARQAFLEKYRSLVGVGASAPTWKLRQGYDQAGRSQAIFAAIHRGQITSTEGREMMDRLLLRDDERKLADAMLKKLIGDSDTRRVE